MHPISGFFAAAILASSFACAVARADDVCETLPNGLYAGIQLRPISDATIEPTADRAKFEVRFSVLNEGDTDAPWDTTTLFVRMVDTLRGWNARSPATAMVDEETGAAISAIAPGRSAIVTVEIADTEFQRCSSLELNIDPDRVLQTACNAFADDARLTPTPCLTWTTPLTASALGTLDVYDAIPKDNPNTAMLADTLQYISIGGFVSSQWMVRPDGNVCSHCHYASNPQPNPFKPEGITMDGLASPILQPDVIYAGRRWDDINDGRGLALQFLGTTSPAKPRYLKLIMERWIRDGMRADPGSLVPALRE